MSQGITKDDLNKALTRFSANINDRFGSFEGRVNKRFDLIDQRFDGVDRRLDSVEGRLSSVESQLGLLNDDMTKVKHGLLDYLGTDRALHNLVRELRGKGIAIEDSKVFAV